MDFFNVFWCYLYNNYYIDASQSLKRGEAAGLVAKGGALPGAFDDTLPCLEDAKMRSPPEAISHDDAMVLEHGDYRKVHAKLEKKRQSLVKSQEKVTAWTHLNSSSKIYDVWYLHNLYARERFEILCIDLFLMIDVPLCKGVS